MAARGLLDPGDSDSEDELPPGWEERTTDNNQVYYVNHYEASTQWAHPRTGKRKRLVGQLPEGWERVVLADGRVIFVNRTDGKSTYTDPRLAFAVEDRTVRVNNTQAPPGPSTPGGNLADAVQRPKQRFDASSTAMQVLVGVDLTDRTILITGASSGIGYETAFSLAIHGAHVIMVCRDVSKAQVCRQKIIERKPNAEVDIIECDLSSLRSVQRCAKTFLLRKWPLHVLILNAGVQERFYSRSDDNFENTFAVNHLAHFYLTMLLTPTLIQSSPSRVVVVSSESHRFADFFGTLDSSKLTEERLSASIPSSYWWMSAYNLSKLCNILFAVEFSNRYARHGVTCNALHPGNMVWTNLCRHSCLIMTVAFLARPFTKSLQQAASTSVYCATARELEGVTGQYFNNCWFCTPHKETQDANLRRKLWEISEDVIQRVCGPNAFGGVDEDRGVFHYTSFQHDQQNTVAVKKSHRMLSLLVPNRN